MTERWVRVNPSARKERITGPESSPAQRALRAQNKKKAPPKILLIDNEYSNFAKVAREGGGGRVEGGVKNKR
jgi:hypothetical protein